MKIFLISISLILSQPLFSLAQSIGDHPGGIWSISSPPDESRWVVIHNLEEAQKTGIFHIEVISRKINSPVWDIQHVVNHMAITKSALSNSIIKPLQKGAVYPEVYETAYMQWQKENGGKGGKICETTIESCMNNKLAQ